MECSDESIKRITLNLLCKTVNDQNAENILAWLLDSLVVTSDSYFKSELTNKILELSTSYAKNFEWFLTKLTVLLENGSEYFDDEMTNKVIWILEENFKDDHSSRNLICSYFL